MLQPNTKGGSRGFVFDYVSKAARRFKIIGNFLNLVDKVIDSVFILYPCKFSIFGSLTAGSTKVIHLSFSLRVVFLSTLYVLMRLRRLPMQSPQTLHRRPGFTLLLLFLLTLFQLVRNRERSSPVCQQSSRPAPLVLLHPPELTLTDHCRGHSVLDDIHHIYLPMVSTPLQFLH